MAQPRSSGFTTRSGLPVKVFTVKQDCDRFRCFFETDLKGTVFQDLMQSKPRLDTWSPPSVYLNKPKLKLGDFCNAFDHYIISNQRATNLLRTHFESAGELLPLPYEGNTYYVINVTRCVDCLDELASTWSIQSGNYRGWILRHIFVLDRLPRSGIFRIPAVGGNQIFTVEGLTDQEEDFRAIVQREGLKGLKFKEVWSSVAMEEENDRK